MFEIIVTNTVVSHTIRSVICVSLYTGNTQKNGAVLIVNTIKTVPFFCVYPVHNGMDSVKLTITLVMSVCLSVRPYERTRLPLDGFS
jgi:hypothetical protein